MDFDFSTQLPEEMLRSVVEGIEIRRMEIPLVRPYRLSFGTLEHYDTILCEVRMGGRVYRGETTTLPGYSHETVQKAWSFTCQWAKKIMGLAVGDALDLIQTAGAADPFCAIGLTSALEGCHPAFDRLEPGSLKAVSALMESEPEKIGQEAGELIRKGYATLKLKVGTNMEDNLRRTAAVLESIPAEARLRLDANQCLSLPQAQELWSKVEDHRIEYLEQPFPRGDWDSLREVSRRGGMRICLDESIFSFDDLETMASIEHPFWVKLKLMKQGSACRTVGLARWLQAHGYPVIMGNGVQGDVGSLREFALYTFLELGSAAELNGFAKQRISPFSQGTLRMADGRIFFDGADLPRPDRENLEAVTQEYWAGSV